ncbi:NlpC/P60 family peptidoglycan-binding protein RipD [Senna tora]|uniref:NlpC/P60 family peptidoglycan-binding protein RipD n=1 Tax=Senna tora TaxID=362788 RepID=A0A834SDQ0_9FABA|nr:NlpC/P60 family peptidoglycan-binding protein RipD [Senna tora]
MRLRVQVDSSFSASPILASLRTYQNHGSAGSAAEPCHGSMVLLMNWTSETVKVHLYSLGFIPNYDQWSFHVEPLHYTEECEIGSAMEESVEAENDEMVDGDHVERVDVNLADPYRTIILEAAGPKLAYQDDEVSIQNEIDDDDEDPQEEVGDEEEVGEEVEIEIEDDDVNDQEDIVEMDVFQDDIEGGFEIDDSSTEDENEDSEDQIDYGSDGDNESMTRGKGKARSTGVDRGGYHKVGRNKSIESVQCPTMEQVPPKQVPIVQTPIEQVSIVQSPIEQVPIMQPPIEQVPIMQLSIEQVPIVELPIEQSPVVDCPPSDVAEEDRLESEGPSLTNTQQENTYLQLRSQPRISSDARTYLEPLRDSYHPHSAIRELTKIIKKYLHGPWATWEGTPTDVKDRWFGELELSVYN